MRTKLEYSSIQDAQKLLEKMFDDFNKKFYEGKLIPAMITIMKSRHGKELGWASSTKVWYQKELDSKGNSIRFYEINICADALYLTSTEIAEVMLHEMAHIYGAQYNIKETSRNGCYHNKQFKTIAEEHGLKCSKTNNGFNDTSLNDDAKDFIKQMNYSELKLARERSYTRHSSYIRYVCPSCGSIIRSTKPVHVLCIDCNVQFQYSETHSKQS